MSDYTTNLNLLKKDPDNDGNDYFNIKTMLNDNWDKIDAGVAAKETPAGAQAKVDNLAGAGRTIQTVKGNADAITALSQTVTTHSAEDAAHGAVPAATANKIIRRDANGRAKVAAPSAADDIARKDNVDAVQTNLNAHTSAAAPHSGHIAHSLATAANDFLVASGAGAFVKKTLAEARTILGLKAAAYLDTGTTASTVALGNHTHAGVYATAAQGTLANNALPKAGGLVSGEINNQDNFVTRPKIKDYSEAIGTTPATTGTVTFDITTGNIFDITPTGACTLAFSNPSASGAACSITVIIRQPSTLYAITFPSSVQWSNGAIPSFITNKTAVLTFVTVNGGTRWYGFLAGNNFTT